MAPLCLSITLLLLPARAHAGVEETYAASSPVVHAVVETVQVRARRWSSVEAALRAGGFSSTLNVVGVSDRSVAEMLGEVPGTHVQSLGGAGSSATAGLRGSAAGQVGVLLDGVPLRWNASGALDLADLPLENLARIEIHRGYTPADLSAGGPGGALHLVSLEGSAPGGTLAVRAGSFGEQQFRCSAHGSPGRVPWQASFSALASGGSFSYHDDHGTPENPEDDVSGTRRNNRVERRQGTLALGGPSRGVRLFAFDTRQGLPGAGYAQTRRARLEREGQQVQAHARWDPSAALRARAEVFASRGEERFFDPSGELHLGNLITASEVTTVGGQWTLLARPRPGLSVQSLLHLRWEQWRPRLLLPASTQSRSASRGLGTWTLQAAHSTGTLQLEGDVRAEWFNDHGASLALPGRPSVRLQGVGLRRILPHASLAWSPVSLLALKAGAGSYQRAPSLAERFGIEGTQVGNPALRPETGTNYDLGLVASVRARGFQFEGELARFGQNATDLIAPIQNSQRTVVPRNIDRARIRGEEARLAVARGEALECGLAATWLRAVDDGPVPYLSGLQLPGRPEREWDFHVRGAAGRCAATLRVHHVERNFLDRAHTQWVAARTLWDLGASLEWPRPALMLDLQIENLTDTQVSDLYGYPMSGRALRVGLRWRNSARETARKGDAS